MKTSYNPNCGSWYAYASWVNTKTILQEIKEIECNKTVINDIDINIKKIIIKLDSMANVLTREDVDYIQEHILKANLEVINHDKKIVRILESMGGIVEPISESTEIAPLSTDVFEIKKGLFGKEKVVKVK